jgi:hypothetical protein
MPYRTKQANTGDYTRTNMQRMTYVCFCKVDIGTYGHEIFTDSVLAIPRRLYQRSLPNLHPAYSLYNYCAPPCELKMHVTWLALFLSTPTPSPFRLLLHELAPPIPTPCYL